MKLKMKINKKSHCDRKNSDANNITIPFYYSKNEYSSSSTIVEIKDDIKRIGGFENETIDNETLNLIKNF